MGKAVKYTVSIPSRSLVIAFKRECKRRGRQQSWVISNAMRYYVEHPQASGWANGEPERSPAASGRSPAASGRSLGASEGSLGASGRSLGASEGSLGASGQSTGG